MFTYSFYEWILFFYVYCFLGWCIESAWVSIRAGRFVNRGFMKGPWLPIYGCGAVTILIAGDMSDGSVIGLFVIGALLATVLEYITGEAMVRIFKVRYWDYSYKKIQLNGHICLSSTLAWGVLSIIMVYMIDPFFEGLLEGIFASAMKVIVCVVSAVMVYDFSKALREALDIRKVLVELEKVKDEFEDYIEIKKEILEERMDELEERIEILEEDINELVKSRKEKFEKNNERRRKELKERIDSLQEDFEKRSKKISSSNPGFKLKIKNKKH